LSEDDGDLNRLKMTAIYNCCCRFVGR